LKDHKECEKSHKVREKYHTIDKPFNKHFEKQNFNDEPNTMLQRSPSDKGDAMRIKADTKKPKPSNLKFAINSLCQFFTFHLHGIMIEHKNW